MDTRRPVATIGRVEFRRITNLPPYVFTIINNLKVEARRAGVDVIDLGLRQPRHPVARDRRREAGRGGAHMPATTATRCREGLPKLREAVAALYERKLGRHPRPRDRDHQHDRLEGGLQPPDVGAAAVGRRRHRAEPELPDPHLRPAVRRRRPAPGRRCAPTSTSSSGCETGVGHRLAEAARARHLASRTTRPARASTWRSCSAWSTSAASTR